MINIQEEIGKIKNVKLCLVMIKQDERMSGSMVKILNNIGKYLSEH